MSESENRPWLTPFRLMVVGLLLALVGGGIGYVADSATVGGVIFFVIFVLVSLRAIALRRTVKGGEKTELAVRAEFEALGFSGQEIDHSASDLVVLGKQGPALLIHPATRRVAVASCEGDKIAAASYKFEQVDCELRVTGFVSPASGKVSDADVGGVISEAAGAAFGELASRPSAEVNCETQIQDATLRITSQMSEPRVFPLLRDALVLDTEPEFVRVQRIFETLRGSPIRAGHAKSQIKLIHVDWPVGGAGFSMRL